MQIKPYKSQNKPAVLELIRANTPEYFAPSEEAELDDYLEQEREDYFVVERNGEIVGAGGINYFLDEKVARISWDMIHPDYQGKGIGSQLTKYRIDLLSKNPAVDTIVVRTSQLVHTFYEKMGFRLFDRKKDFWAKGYDLYEMKNVV